MEDAGFTIPKTAEYSLSYTISAPPPWFLGVIIGAGEQPPHAQPVLKAFQQIGIEAVGVDGKDIIRPGEVKIYVGSK